MKNKDSKQIRYWLNAGSIGISFVAAIAIGTLIGFYLDKKFNSKPYCTIFFMIMGIAAGFKNMIYFIKRANVYEDLDKKN
ncbi:MAG: AtpZ/AtpI family protein [Calditerrivibrio sp.]|nr:AtpZ/AtpI family protein [Calditerrivibrio sp.]